MATVWLTRENPSWKIWIHFVWTWLKIPFWIAIIIFLTFFFLRLFYSMHTHTHKHIYTLDVVNHIWKASDNGNVSISILSYSPTREDNGKVLICRAMNEVMKHSIKETTLKLNIYCKYPIPHISYLLNQPNQLGIREWEWEWMCLFELLFNVWLCVWLVCDLVISPIDFNCTKLTRSN